MTKQEFEDAVDRCRQSIVSGSAATRIVTKQVLLDEHARLVDGIAALQRLCAEISQNYEALKPGPNVVILDEESGFIDGLPEAGE